MIDGDFEIDGHTYGKRQGVFVRGVAPGAPEWRTQDQVNPAGNNMFFGRDHVTPAPWTVSLGTKAKTAAEARQLLGSLAAVWSKPLRTPGAEQVLKYCVGGEVRRIYGRCRGVPYEVPATVWSGYIPAEAQFATRDTLTYSDTEQTSGRLSLLPGVSASVALPAPLPLVFASSGPRSGAVTAGGDAEAPVVIRVHGPLTGWWYVTVGGWRVGVNLDLAYDRQVEIDTRTMTVLMDDGTSVAGKVSRSVFLPDVRLPVGTSEVGFEGNDDTGTSWAEVLWRDAWFGF